LLINNLFSTILLNFAFVLRARNLYSCQQNIISDHDCGMQDLQEKCTTKTQYYSAPVHECSTLSRLQQLHSFAFYGHTVLSMDVSILQFCARRIGNC